MVTGSLTYSLSLPARRSGCTSFAAAAAAIVAHCCVFVVAVVCYVVAAQCPFFVSNQLSECRESFRSTTNEQMSQRTHR